MNRKTFKCDRGCGKCCRKVIILLDSEDMARIKKLGYSKEEFAESYGPRRKTKMLSNSNGDCIFLEKSKGMYSCKIYPSRPETCQKYPFFGMKVEDCRDVLGRLQL
ncbi:MAG TPA: YkgJ family cysteine cluster protein [Candidatus Nanoarchaeia archaeon]|nr:YkgJ family cysteine cluster protein [Candidatus Nanoarchaeia archaeon]